MSIKGGDLTVCRGCAGTGIDAGASPRQAEIAQLPIRMARGVFGPSSPSFVGQVSAVYEVGRLRYQAPLILLAEHVERRIKDGYQLIDGELPDRSLACEWCNGYGSAEGQLTVHNLEKLAERYDTD